MAEVKLVNRGDRWPIQMSWPDYNPRFFGYFDTDAEAGRWIKEHSRLAPDTKASAVLPDPKPAAASRDREQVHKTLRRMAEIVDRLAQR